MSQIFTPDQIPISPKYLDGLQNLVTRGVGDSTSSTTFASIVQTIILPKAFGNDRPNVCMEFKYVGRIINATGNKQYQILIDGNPMTFSATTISISPAFSSIELIIAYINNTINAQAIWTLGPGMTGASIVSSAGFGAPLAFDPDVPHVVQLAALTANPAAQITCDWFGASLR
jgi:hypothetical protein